MLSGLWRRVIALAVLLTFAASVAGAGTQTYMAHGSKIAVRLVPERSTILLGEPIYLSFIVENRSGRDLQVITGDERIPGANNRARFALSAVRRDGMKVLPPPSPPLVAGNWMVGPRDLPAHKSYTFDLFLPSALPIDAPGMYTITCRKMLKFTLPSPDGRWDAHAKRYEVVTQTSAALTVLPADAHHMGEVIDRLGQAATADFANNGRLQEQADRAAVALGAIKDRRAVPWFVKLVHARDSNRKQAALWALAKFDDAAAFAAIKAALATRGTDLDNCTTAQVAEEAARGVRLAAVFALAQSPYPAALPVLLSLRRDRDENVRLQVVHAAGEHKSAETSAVLREMMADPSKMVSDEAARYLRLRTAPAPDAR